MALQPVSLGTNGEIAEIIAGLRILWMRAFNRGDGQTVAGLYAPEAVLLPPNGVAARGIQAVGAAVKGLLDAGFGDVRLEDEQVEYSGGLAVESGRYSMRLPSDARFPIQKIHVETALEKSALHSGVVKERRGSGKYVSTWRRQANGEFKITVSVWTSDSE